jgi:carboxyl-terminal processing protease
MRELKTPLLVSAVVVAVFISWAGCKTDSVPAPTPIKVGKLQPGPGAARIAYYTAWWLENYHYSQHPLDTEMSQKFFDAYVDMLDGRHEHFLQTDLEEFACYRTNLDKLTLGKGKQADLTPAFAIYERFSERFQQHFAYVNELLARDKFKFTADEKYVYDRRREPFPKNLDEAKNLWRLRLRYEYLQEKLAREIQETNGVFTVKLPPGAVTNITEAVAKRYRLQMRWTTNSDAGTVLQVYLNALAHAYDPHSDYFSAPKAQDFSMQMNLSLFGIGAKLQDDEGYCTIKELIPGGPATTSKKIKVEDRIVAVAQADKPPVDVVNMELEKVVQMIRGPKNTKVRLTISPAENRTTRREIELVRDEIKLENAEAKAKLIEDADGHRFGIIDLPSFYAPVDLGSAGSATPKYTSVDVAQLLKKLKDEKVSGLILDLRNNPGGSLEEAVRFTGLFIKDGPVVLARDPDGRVLVDGDPDPSQPYDGPLVVLVNRFSASASEIAAAALQDYGRAIVIGGNSTHGKGTVQNLNRLDRIIAATGGGVTNDPGTLKVTIRKFYRINGGSTQFKGVVPDIVLPDTWNYSKIVGESALDNALPWDEIRPVPHQEYKLTEPFLGLLRANSAARLATNQDYKYVREDIEQFQKLQLEQAATLNEHEAIKERERVVLQNKAREKERAARAQFSGKFYDLSLADAAKPGLPLPLAPAPLAETNKIAGTNGIALMAFTTNLPGVVVVSTNLLTGTNSAAADSEKLTGSKPPSYQPKPGEDPMLEEAQQILKDYIALLAKNGLTATR